MLEHESHSLLDANDTNDTILVSSGSETSIEPSASAIHALSKTSETHLSMYPFKIEMLDGSSLMPDIATPPLRPKRRPLGLARALQNAVSRKCRAPQNYTILVLGNSASGKSTFIRMLYEELPRSVERVFVDGLELEIHESKPIRGMGAKLRVIDVPQFSLGEDNYSSGKAIIKYLDEQLSSYVRQEEQPDRCKLRDFRVHVCIYFLSPQACILPLDIMLMGDVSDRTNLIPVVSRSDSCTADELAQIKRALRECFSIHDIHLTSAVAQDAPYAIVCSTEYIAPGVKGRRYPWGSVNVESSDLPKLYGVLLTHSLDLIEEMQDVYYRRFRNKSMLERFQDFIGTTDGNATNYGGLSNVQMASIASNAWELSNSADHSEQVARLKKFYSQQYNAQYRRLEVSQARINQTRRELDSQIAALRENNSVLEARIADLRSEQPSSLPAFIRPFRAFN